MLNIDKNNFHIYNSLRCESNITLIVKDCRELLSIKINLNKDYLDYERDKRKRMEDLIEYNKTFNFTSDSEYENRKNENEQYIERAKK